MDPISRRSTLRGLGVVAVSGIVGYVAGRRSDAVTGHGSSGAANSYGAAAGGGRRLADVDQLPQDGGVILKGDKVVLTRDSSGGVHAFSSICPHQGCPVDRISGGRIICPCHGSEFDVKTGAVIKGPASTGLPEVAVEVRGGEIYTS